MTRVIRKGHNHLIPTQVCKNICKLHFAENLTFDQPHHFANEQIEKITSTLLNF